MRPNNNADLDKEIFVKMLTAYINELDEQYQNGVFDDINKKYNGNIQKYADKVYSKSMFASEEKMQIFLDGFSKKSYKKMEKDPAFALSISLYENYGQNIRPQLISYNNQLDSLYRLYMRNILKINADYADDSDSKTFISKIYPDANQTLRITYGKVETYEPKNGVTYNYYTTLEGIIEKEDSTIYDYKVDDKLKGLYEEKDYGEYANEEGELPVAFIASNHTTGGNSGSPVLNAEGELIGINFDRCWEGTMSDIVYSKERCRNISIDIRYCLFIIDKYAGCRHIIEELELY